jgi:broad specificity phosphatase PhoE
MGINSIKNSSFNYLKNYSSSNFSSSISQEKTNYIILTCKGQTENIVEDAEKNQSNQQLSSLGIDQALDIGIQLKLNLLGINLSEINIFTSPYISDIQTVLNITNSFDNDDSINKYLYINKNLSDKYNPSINYKNSKDNNYHDLYNKVISPLYYKKKYTIDNNNVPKIKNNISSEKDEENIIINRFNEITESIYKYIEKKSENNNNNSLNIICIPKIQLKYVLEKLISIVNSKKEDKINTDIIYENKFVSTYCFKITPQKELIYLGELIPKKTENKNIINKNKDNRYIAIMRHGERIDNTNFKKNQELPKYDPELTYEGMKQAINVGIQLNNFLRDENIELNEINIFNSPSSRTLQTGILAAGAVDYSDEIEKNIRIITDLNETSVEGGFENNKEESPIYYYKDKDKNLNILYDKYITKLIKDRNYRYGTLDFSSILGKEMLEDGEKMKQRAQNVINNIKNFSQTSYNQGENTLNIISTHQLNVSMIVEYLIDELNKEKNEKEKIEIKDQAFGYCCCYLFKFDENDEFSFIGLLKPDIYDCFQYNLIKFN